MSTAHPVARSTPRARTARPLRALALALTGAALLACPSEPTAPVPSASPSPSGPTSAPAVTTTPDPTPTAASSTLTLAGTPTTAAAIVEPTPAAVPAGCPAWVGLDRCSAGAHTYASAEARGIRDANLARVTAGNRSRAALLAGPHGKLEDAEVVRTEVCGGATWALARVSSAGVPAAPACAAGVIPE
jgi:hypothetical protein